MVYEMFEVIGSVWGKVLFIDVKVFKREVFDICFMFFFIDCMYNIDDRILLEIINK